MKRSSTMFLRVVIVLIGILVLGIAIIAFPVVSRVVAEIAAEWHPILAYTRYPLLISFIATAGAFFTALYQTLKLLGYIDKNQAFSDLSVKALKTIKYAAFVFSVLCAAVSPLFYLVAELDDAPGILLLILVLSMVAFVVAVFVAVLEKLFEDAVTIKSENELTV